MIGYVVRRLLGLVPVLLASATIVWFVMFVLPGDPARLIAGGQSADPDVLASIRAEWGLDLPAPVQYLRFLGRLLCGDLGTSYVQKRPVAVILAGHLPASLVLAAAAATLAIVAGVALGCLAALYRGRLPDLLVLLLALLGTSTPVFWLGLMLMLLFRGALGWLPATGYGMEGAVIPFTAIRLPEWEHLVLPAVTLSMVSIGVIARMARAGLIEAGAADYLRAAAARGVGTLQAFLRHALMNALIPVVTVAAIDFAAMLGGAVATEYVFAWPGLGKAIVRAIALKDLPLVEGGVLFLTVVFVLVNLAVDLLYVWLDPRIHFGASPAAA